ncbi:MAG: WD40/YVTN/BNR-like repeat-containing protein [Acidobacteriota bacterium]|jgi:hypothetical protein
MKIALLFVSVIANAMVNVPLVPKDGLSQCRIDFGKPLIGVFVCPAIRIGFSTNDGGASWSPIKFPDANLRMDIGNSVDIVVCSENNLIYHDGVNVWVSQDMGIGWQKKDVPSQFFIRWSTLKTGCLQDSDLLVFLQAAKPIGTQDSSRVRLLVKRGREEIRSFNLPDATAPRLVVATHASYALVFGDRLERFDRMLDLKISQVRRSHLVDNVNFREEQHASLDCSGSHCWLLFDSGYLLKSTDNGITWETISRPTQIWATTSFIGIATVAFVTNKHGYLLGADGKMRYSTDGGTTWLAIGKQNVSFVSLTCFGINQCKALTDDGKLAAIAYGKVDAEP